MTRLIFSFYCQLAFLSTIAAFGFFPQASHAQFVSNGYICAPKNIGGEETRLYFRQQDGAAVNISRTATFPVVCPIIMDYYYFPEGLALYSAGVTLRNDSDVTQKFQCALEEYNLGGFKEKSTGAAISLEPGGVGLIQYELFETTSELNYAGLRCILPPRGMIAEVIWF
tara:strand:- start:10091 stop:10597 length:507 start_codon:yes stop_codon:yes gene_type:complete